MTEMISAAENPALANDLVNQILASQEEAAADLSAVAAPSGSEVELCGGLVDPITGSVSTTAEIRELNGIDEEAIGKVEDAGKALLTVLERGVVRVGEEKATAKLLDDLLAADREVLLLAIRKATFGAELELTGPCPHCGQAQDFTIDLDKDIEIKKLASPASDQVFDVKISQGTARVALPLGSTQRKLIAASNRTSAELDTLLLKECVQEINGKPVIDVRQVQLLSIKDRRTLLDAIAERNPGPQLSDVAKACSACGQEVPLPLTLAYLFRTW